MKSRSLQLSLVLAALAVGVAVALPAEQLLRRQFQFDTQEKIQDQSKDDPIGATKMVLNMPHLSDYGYDFGYKEHGQLVSGWGDSKQVSWFNNGSFPFTKTVDAPGDQDNGWQSVPESLEGLELKTDVTIAQEGDTTVVQPYYISKNVNTDQVKRVVIVLPGKPRQAWKYANLMYNALKWVNNQNLYGRSEGDAIIVAPVVLNNADKSAGGAKSNWAVYRLSNWDNGGVTHSPELDHSVSFFTALDDIIDKFMDRSEYPNVEKVVVAGHSLGAMAAQRHAVQMKSKNEDRVAWWIGNPGAWTWLVSDRPVKRDDCASSENDFPYGLDDEDNYTKYLKSQGIDASDIVSRYRSRSVHYALALLDNQLGDSHCEAQAQGVNHLQRGANYVMMLNNQDGGLPDTHSVSYIAGVSHQDYPMFAAAPSLAYLFGDAF
ncbi:hypothetical protein MSPP1_004070 [Malassezia sp. CBS 17886]|nr:hypothetical protein MSPP1_004070 [Malassezia sp. CBS 17886]